MTTPMEPITYQLVAAAPRKWLVDGTASDQISIPAGHWLVIATTMTGTPARLDYTTSATKWGKFEDLKSRAQTQQGVYQMASDGSLTIAIVATSDIPADEIGAAGAVTLLPLGLR